MAFWRWGRKATEPAEQPVEEQSQTTTEVPPLEPPELDILRIRKEIEEYLAGSYGPLQSLEIVTWMEPIGSGKGAVVFISFVERGETPVPRVGAFYVSADTNVIKAFLIVA